MLRNSVDEEACHRADNRKIPKGDARIPEVYERRSP